jgi:hypothetical protein
MPTSSCTVNLQSRSRQRLGNAIERCDFGHFGHPRQTGQASAAILKRSDVASYGGPPEMIKHMFDHREH